MKDIITGLFSLPDKLKFTFRFPIRKIVVKLFRKHGFENIHGFVPEADQKLLTSIRREEARKQKRRQQRILELKGKAPPKNIEAIPEETPQNRVTKKISIEKMQKRDDKLSKRGALSFEDILASDSESDDDMIVTKDKQSKRPQSATWIIEDASDPVDFLDPTSLKNIVSAVPNQRKITFGAQDKIFKRTSEGRLIIEDSKNPLPDKMKKELLMEGSIMMPKSEPSEFNPSAKKRKKDRFEQDDEMTEGQEKRGGESGSEKKHLSLVQIRNLRKQKQEGNKNDKMTGKDYRAKKGGGDLKKNSKYEPFAYIKMDPKIINKRFSHQALEQFKAVTGKSRKKQVSAARKKN